MFAFFSPLLFLWFAAALQVQNWIVEYLTFRYFHIYFFVNVFWSQATISYFDLILEPEGVCSSSNSELNYFVCNHGGKSGNWRRWLMSQFYSSGHGLKLMSQAFISYRCVLDQQPQSLYSSSPGGSAAFLCSSFLLEREELLILRKAPTKSQAFIFHSHKWATFDLYRSNWNSEGGTCALFETATKY